MVMDSILVGENLHKRWVLRIQVDGRRHDFGLGNLRKVSLTDAREQANELRTQYVNGLDPAVERKKIFQNWKLKPSIRRGGSCVPCGEQDHLTKR